MTKLLFNESLSSMFGEQLVVNIKEHAKAYSIFCDFLAKLINYDLHVVDLSNIFEFSLLDIDKHDEARIFLADYRQDLINKRACERLWVDYLVPRVHVLLHTITFDKRQLDDTVIAKVYDNLASKLQISESRAIELWGIGGSKMNARKTRCKDENWYYDDTLVDNLEFNQTASLKTNTSGLFYTLLKALWPKFIDDFAKYYGTRMHSTAMLLRTTKEQLGFPANYGIFH